MANSTFLVVKGHKQHIRVQKKMQGRKALLPINDIFIVGFQVTG